MATVVVPAISASEIVDVIPSVLSAGGTALDLSGVMLTTNPRVPIGTVMSFIDATDADNYFGDTSQEAALADIYFNGFQGSNKKPGQLFFSQYVWQEPVSAYLRGGNISSLTLAQLQALSGTLAVTIDATPVTASISLAGATSFSNGAEIIANTLGIKGLSQGSYTGAIVGGTLTITALGSGPVRASYIGSISGTTLTVTSIVSGVISVGDQVSGTGISANTVISALGSGQGGIGTYTVNNSQTSGSQSITGYSPNGALQVGSVLTGTGVTLNTYITALLTGTGGIGTYSVNPNQNAGSEAITAAAPAVVYDSVSGAYVIYSGTSGVNSSISFGTGALSTSLLLTQATGAVTSQGSAQNTPAAAMNAIIATTQNWASFMTCFEPDDATKEGFAAWNNSKSNRYHYAMQDTSILDTETGGPSAPVAAITAANYSGVSLIYENPTIDTVGGEIAAFLLGFCASIDFTETQGRATAAFKSQTGLTPQVTNTGQYGFITGYGMNCYGSFTTANEAFTFYSPGAVTGPFEWLDSYVDQIWLTNALQLALMVLLTQVKSIPYNQQGYGLIAAAMKDPILQAVNAGVIQPGVPLSQAQAVEVNQAAGVTIDNVLSTTGWYLQIKPATAQVRAARTSPPITLWFTDGEAVQKLDVASVLIQ